MKVVREVKILLVSVWVILLFTRPDRSLFPFQGHIFTDTVKDNDGGVDGVTNDGQHAGDEGISDGNTGHCIEHQDYQHIMYQRQNGTCCKTDIFETEPDVEQHADGSNDHCHNRVFSHLASDRSGNILR